MVSFKKDIKSGKEKLIFCKVQCDSNVMAIKGGYIQKSGTNLYLKSMWSSWHICHCHPTPTTPTEYYGYWWELTGRA